MQIAVLEGYRVPRRSKMAKRRRKRRSGGRTAQRRAMKACARKHKKVTSRPFWACVRRKLGR